ncbi:MAG: hypothetical protein Q9169_008376, partial [Polycauliona sp. 2 TL-2023]
HKDRKFSYLLPIDSLVHNLGYYLQENHIFGSDTMLLQSLLVTSVAVTPVFSCAGHLARRQESTDADTGKDFITDWTYDASYDWGSLKPFFATCQTGTQQSPIGLSSSDGFSQYHQPTFTGYDSNVTGNWSNGGYGPTFDLDNPNNDYTSLPAMTYDNVTVYLSGWHLHAPAEHPVDGQRSRSEMHLVHVTSTGSPAAVLGIRLDPGTGGTPSPFFAQLPPMIPFARRSGDDGDVMEPEVVQDVSISMDLILEEVARVQEFWTYKGSLTTPPCTEGLRWFVAGVVALTSVQQMQEILGACTFSTRVEQKVWQHDVNGA